MSSPLTKDHLIQVSFSVYENKGVFALLLGSGISKAAGIPTGWEITLDLIRRVAQAQGIEDQSSWANWYRAFSGQEPNYSKLLEELAFSPEERRAILHSYIEPTPEDREEGKKVPTEAHRAIAALVHSGYVRVIITTNFDRLLESALREQGVEPTVIASVDALIGAEPIAHAECYILKVHGDYKDARILNTDAELSAYPDEFNLILDRIMDEYGLVVCGWSGDWDHALRAALLRAPNRRYSTYWTSQAELGSGALELVNHRRAQKITIADADSFFKGVLQRVRMLEQTRRQNPLSIDLLVNATKRYLSKPDYRIQLDDLFTEEVGRLTVLLDGSDFSAQRNWTPEEFNVRVERYESATEPLARMIGMLGRWGDGTELTLTIDVIRMLHAHAGKEGAGTTGWLNMRSYPAVLIFNAYGLGLMRSQRWSTLRLFFGSELAWRYGEPKRMAEELFLTNWEGGEPDIWIKLKGQDRKITPLSNHLFHLYSEWAKSFVGISPDFELLFDRFELLAALSCLENTTEGELEEVIANQSSNSFIWIPVGRIGWNRRTKDVLLKELRSPNVRGALLESGFYKGNGKFLDLALSNFERIARKMSW